MTSNHQAFLDKLAASRWPVLLVASQLTALGHTIQIPGDRVAATREQWRENSDEGDLYIVRGDERLRIEVKHLTAEFTGSKDWPFGRDFIVCNKRAYDDAQDKPHRFIILSKDLEHQAHVPGDTYCSWTNKERVDHTLPVPEKQQFYFCPLELVHFKKSSWAKS